MKYCYRCQRPLSKKAVYGLHSTCFMAWFKLSQVQEFQNLDPKKGGTASASAKIDRNQTKIYDESRVIAHNLGQIGVKRDRATEVCFQHIARSDGEAEPQDGLKCGPLPFYHGRYAKYSARLGGVDYILKVQEDDFPELPLMEFVCNRIASRLSLEVPDYYLINFGERPTFVTRNFMQGRVGTLNHLYKFLAKGREYNCQNIIEVISDKTGKISEAIKFVEMCLFDALTGNNDRHGRNIALVHTAKGITLAPAYDNPSYFGVEREFLLGADLNPSGSVWTAKSKEPKLRDYLGEFERLGFAKVCARFKRRLQGEFQHIMAEVKCSSLSAKRQSAFLDFMEKKMVEIEDE